MNNSVHTVDHYLAWQTALEVFKGAKQAKVPEQDVKRLGYLAYRCYLLYLRDDADHVRFLIAEMGSS